MKKLLAVVLTTVCVLSFSACDSDYDKSEDKTTTSTTTTTTEPTTTTTTTKKTTTTTKKKTTTTKKKTTITKKATTTKRKDEIAPVLYNDNSVTIKYSKSSYDYSDRLNVYFYVKNKTSKTLLIQADSISVNGYSFPSIVMSDTVTPNSTGIVCAKIDDVDNTLISNIKSVGGQLRIINDDTFSDSYNAILPCMKIDGSGTQAIPKAPSNTVFFNNNDITIYYKNASNDEYDTNRLRVQMYIVNKTSHTILIQSDAITLNGFSFSDVIMSDCVPPQTMGIVTVKIDEVDYDLANENNITTMGGKFRIIDDSSWNNSYDIVF